MSSNLGNHVKHYKRSVSFYKMNKTYMNKYVEMYLWFNKIFDKKDLKKFRRGIYSINDDNRVIYYGRSKDDILFEEDFNHECIYVSYNKFISGFEKFFGVKSISKYLLYTEDVEDIFLEYLKKEFNLKMNDFTGTLNLTTPSDLVEI